MHKNSRETNAHLERQYPLRSVQTRYLLIAAAITALAILTASLVWMTLTFA